MSRSPDLSGTRGDGGGALGESGKSGHWDGTGLQCSDLFDSLSAASRTDAAQSASSSTASVHPGTFHLSYST